MDVKINSIQEDDGTDTIRVTFTYKGERYFTHVYPGTDIREAVNKKVEEIENASK